MARPAAAPTAIANERREPKHLVADAPGATWIESTDTTSTVWHVAKGGPPKKLVTVRGTITAFAHGGPVLVADEVAEAAYAGAITWGLTDRAIVVLAP